MPRLFRFLFIVLLILGLSSPQAVKAETQGPVPNVPQTDRLVVFEGFLASGCISSLDAGLEMDWLAAGEYQNKPVVFLEYNGSSPNPLRINRFWAATAMATLPYAMADSGSRFFSPSGGAGTAQLFYNEYKKMLDAELARPPQADVIATWKRVGDQVTLTVTLTNLSGVTLSSGNSATVQGLMYINKKISITNRYVLQVTQGNISSLAPGQTATYTLPFTTMNGTDWSKVEFLALVDYRPGGNTGPYDMLQAAKAQQESTPQIITVSPGAMMVMTDPAGAGEPDLVVDLQGAGGTSWTASSGEAWLLTTPSAGTGPGQVHLTLDKAAMAPGWQQGTVTFTTSGGSNQVTVQAYLGTITTLQIPLVSR